jgi:hypothetical protein
LEDCPDIVLIVIDALQAVAACMTLATSQTTIDLEFGEHDRLAFGPCSSSPMKELVDQEMGMAFVPSMTGIDGKDFHCSRLFHNLEQFAGSVNKNLRKLSEIQYDIK